ncbi:MAG: DUF99 family protein [Candidatus Korarchaeum sp.]
MKGSIRVLAVDDTPFERRRSSRAFLIGLMFRGLVLEYAVKESVEVDGDDSTEALIRMVMDPKIREEVRLVMTHGTTFAGLNVLDVLKFHEETGVPLIAVTSRMPTSEIEKAIESAGLHEKLILVRKNPPYSPLRTPKGLCYYSKIGLSDREAERIILRYSSESKVPEQLRVADIIAKLFQGLY